MRFGGEDSAPTGDGMTGIERGDQDGRRTFQQYINLVAMLARSDLSGRHVVRRFASIPSTSASTSAKRPWSKMSIPMTPSPELANRILRGHSEFSEPFGTKIGIENGVGVIRVAPRRRPCRLAGTFVRRSGGGSGRALAAAGVAVSQDGVLTCTTEKRMMKIVEVV